MSLPDWSFWNCTHIRLFHESQVSTDFPLPSCRLSTYHAGPWATSQPLHSSRMLHLPLLRNTLSLAAQSPLSLTCSSFPLLLLVQSPGMPLPASLALEASLPAMWISPFSNSQLHFLSVSVASAPITALHQSSSCFPCRYLSLSTLLSLQGSPRSLPLWVPTKPVELSGYTKWTHISRLESKSQAQYFLAVSFFSAVKWIIIWLLW